MARKKTTKHVFPEVSHAHNHLVEQFREAALSIPQNDDDSGFDTGDAGPNGSDLDLSHFSNYSNSALLGQQRIQFSRAFAKRKRTLFWRGGRVAGGNRAQAVETLNAEAEAHPRATVPGALDSIRLPASPAQQQQQRVVKVMTNPGPPKSPSPAGHTTKKAVVKGKPKRERKRPLVGPPNRPSRTATASRNAMGNGDADGQGDGSALISRGLHGDGDSNFALWNATEQSPLEVDVAFMDWRSVHISGRNSAPGCVPLVEQCRRYMCIRLV